MGVTPDVRSLLRARPSDRAFAWVVESVGSGASLDAWMVVPGGSACAIHAVDVVDGRGRRHPLLLKRFLREDWLAREPDVVEREARHLGWLDPVALPLPRLVAVDPRGAACDVPALLMTRLPGRPQLLPENLDAWLLGLVESCLALHELPDSLASRFPPYRCYRDLARLAVPGWTRRPRAWERLIERLQAAPPASAAGFVHRDYHPGNLLWQRGRVSGVLDFPSCCYGPAAVDLAHCRINLAQLHGPDVADRFLHFYQSRIEGLPDFDPYWDLVGLADWLPGPEAVYPGWQDLSSLSLSVETCWQRLDELAERALARL